VANEREKMLAGELYDPLDPELVAARERARDLCQTLNTTREGEQEERRRILRELFGAGGDTVWMEPPFYCDYGANIELGTPNRATGTHRRATAQQHFAPGLLYRSSRRDR
jgi:maltose O-acetyltransferase